MVMRSFDLAVDPLPKHGVYLAINNTHDEIID